MSVRHIGSWPFRDETGSGPIARNHVGGIGGGCKIYDPYNPAYTTDFPWTVPTKTDAMWWFWNVFSWGFSVSTPYMSYADVINTYPEGIDYQQDLVTAHNGLIWRFPDSSNGGVYSSKKSIGGGLYIEVAVTSAVPIEADYPQVIFNQELLYIPRVTVYITIEDDGSHTGNEYTIGLTTDPGQSTFYGGSDMIDVPLGPNVVRPSGSFDGFGPVDLSFSVSELW